MSDYFAIFVFLFSLIPVIYLPIYLQRRKNWRIADDDLKKIDHDEWKKQIKSNAYISLISRVIWGLLMLALSVIDFRTSLTASLNSPGFLIGLVGASLIAWGIFGFRRESKNLSKIE